MTPTISQTLVLGREDSLHAPKQLLFIDWLSFQGHMANQSFLTIPPEGYRVEPKETGTPLYQCLFMIVSADGRAICSLQSVPRHKYQDPDSVAVKLDNALLYSADWYSVLLDFIRAFQIRRINISRVDFAMDSQAISYGISTKDFAERLADSRFVKSGTREISVHKRSNIYIDETSKGDELSFQTDNLPSINAVTIGRHGSMCQCQVYNKTLELKQHLAADGTFIKSYIPELWAAGGLDTTKDVWRIELRLSSKADTLEFITPEGEIKHRKILLSDLDPTECEDTIRGRKISPLKDTIQQAFNRWFNVYSLENEDLSKLQHITRQSKVRILSENSELSFAAHAAQSKSMTKYLKGVVRFITDLFQSSAAILKDRPDYGVIQAYAIKHFLENLYDVCKGINTAKCRAVQAGTQSLTEDFHKILSYEFDRIISASKELRRVLCINENTQLEVIVGDHTERMTQEEFEWLTKFESCTIKNK